MPLDTCDSPFSGEDTCISDGEFSNAESSDSVEDSHVSICSQHTCMLQQECNVLMYLNILILILIRRNYVNF